MKASQPKIIVVTEDVGFFSFFLSEKFIGCDQKMATETKTKSKTHDSEQSNYFPPKTNLHARKQVEQRVIWTVWLIISHMVLRITDLNPENEGLRSAMTGVVLRLHLNNNNNNNNNKNCHV